MANGKAKGSGYERDICKMLTEWLTGKSKPYVWWRSPSSGALATITAQNPNLTGDIIAVLPEGHFLTDIFSIEVKVGYPSSSFNKFFSDCKNNEIEQFWKQACNDSSKSNKEPMLIYKKDRKEPLLFIKEKVKNLFDGLDDLNYFMLKFGSERVYVFNTNQFFTKITPNDIMKMEKKNG